MKKIDAQRKYKELFDNNVELQEELDEASEDEDYDGLVNIGSTYSILLDQALTVISKLILTGVQDEK